MTPPNALSEELLPCPFCGDKPEFSAVPNDPGRWRVVFHTDHENCMANSIVNWNFGRKEHAIERWNRRSPALRREPWEVVEQAKALLRRVMQSESGRKAMGEFWVDDVSLFLNRSALASSQGGG